MAWSFEVKLSSLLHWKGRRSSKQYMKDTWESASAKTEQDTVCFGLKSSQTSHTSLNHAQDANITAHRNLNSHSSQHSPRTLMSTPQCWLLPLWWIWIPSCHGLLLQDAHCQKNPCISMQCLQDHLSPEGTLHRTWHPRGTPYWQRSLVCQYTLHWVCNRLDVWP